ncbi:MAG: hypothetical protein J6W42_08480 [Bacteroidaceae bacterium]|nr:hypothetical protein [Bacteroidaceae bacterium]
MRKIKIWFSRGWWHVVSCVSFLLLSLLCNSCKSTSSVNRSQNENRETVSAENDSIIMDLEQLTADMIAKVKAYEKNSNSRVMTVYGPPYENGEEEPVLEVPSKRALRKARKAGK